MPKLRTVRFRAHGVDSLDLEHLPVLPKLENLSVDAKATTLRGLTRLGHALPSLTCLSLASSRPIMKESLPGLEMLRELRLHLPAIPVWPLAWARLHHLGLNVAGASDEQVREVLVRCSTVLRSLSLQGTDVSDAIFDAVDGFSLDHLDLADTRITLDALEAYVLRHPGLRYLPRRPPSPSTTA